MPRPFIDRPLDDLDAAGRAARTAAEEWELPSPDLLRSSMNATFVAGDVVLRVGRPTARPEASIELLRTLETAGIAVPRSMSDRAIEFDGLAVTAWERIRSAAPVDWERVGEMVALLHELDPSVLPEDYPLTTPPEIPWWELDEVLDEVRDALDRPALDGLEAAIGRGAPVLRVVDPEAVVCHGDVHPGNVVSGPDGPVLLDWDLLAKAPRGWDHGPLMTWEERWGGEPIYADFARGYGWSGRGDVPAEAFAELRLVAATLMRVRAAMSDPAARPEADLRLRYWRGEVPSPVWTAQ